MPRLGEPVQKKAHFSKWAGRLETLPLILGKGRDVSYQVGLPDADSLIAQNDVPRMERWEITVPRSQKELLPSY